MQPSDTMSAEPGAGGYSRTRLGEPERGSRIRLVVIVSMAQDRLDPGLKQVARAKKRVLSVGGANYGIGPRHELRPWMCGCPASYLWLLRPIVDSASRSLEHQHT